MKILAMYLPQFHRVLENDEWWGNGFTDWVSAKKAKTLYEGHYQPHVPLGENYYNLLNKDVMVWQAELMKKYGVDGMCIYHYWFKDGRKILEKPAENLLQWKEIEMPFCFCWANETWARSWAQIQGANSWADMYEQYAADGSDQSQKAILLEQQYGEKKDWKKHFDYLNMFFRDERYIKIDDKPIFVIYKTADISCLEEMICYWQECAKEYGWKGLYVIGGQSNGRGKGVLEGELICEPGNEMQYFHNNEQNKTVDCIDYATIWDYILENEPSGYKHTYYCGVTGFDDTPRRGKRGHVLIDNSPQAFNRYMIKLLAKSKAEGNDIVFVNAWNEWGEGMHLEPDEKYCYSYLEALSNAKKEYTKYEYQQSNMKRMKKLCVLEQKQKFELYMNTLDLWLQLLENDISIADYLRKKGLLHIGVYGVGILGRHLLRELNKNEEVQVEFIVDKQKDKLQLDIPVYSPDEDLPQSDVIIVTAFYYFEEIAKEMSAKANLISLKEIIDNCLTIG